MAGQDPFVAEISIVAFNFAPKGYATCDGQILPLSQNTALFSLLGTTYGGNGQSNFALPDLQGRAPMHHEQGPGLSNRSLGEVGGTETVTLLTTEIPVHTHNLVPAINAGGPATSINPDNTMPGVAQGTDLLYSATAGAGSLKPMTITNPNTIPTGGGQPHNNMQPYLSLNFIIALQGIFPPRS